jgi:glycosyltransferase involved in cell wall biosynthesis
MSYSLPIVASDWNGYRDIVDDGITGFLVRTTLADDITAQLLELPFCDPGQLHDRLTANVRIDFREFGAAMVTLAGDPGLRERLGRTGHDRLLRDFTLDGVVLRYTSLWMELCDKARRNPDRTLGLSAFVDYARVFAGHPSAVSHQTAPIIVAD